MLRILDHLINQRTFVPAIFFKGMVLKYGLEDYDKGEISGARKLLEEARAKGVGGATIELQHLNRFSVLDSIPSVHIT